MPPEMREAFFGSNLAEKSRLMAQNPASIAPLQSSDQITTTAINNNTNNEYTIKLDHETVSRFLMKKATKLALGVKDERQQPVVPTPAPSNSVQPPNIPGTDDDNEMRTK